MEIYNGEYCIYVHTNKINGKKYVGQTKHGNNLYLRWGKNGSKYKNCTYFYNAIKKYGWNNFEHEIIASNLTVEEANNFEELLISKFDTRNHSNGYNIKCGGNNYKLADETKKKISEAMLAEKNPHYGKKHSKATKKILSDKAKQRIGKRASHKKETFQYDLQGHFIKKWDCAADAGRELGISNRNISQCCANPEKYKTANGFKWSYANVA